MVNKHYTCSFCNKQFRRKWNAFRHNTSVHHDLAKIESRLNSQNLRNQKSLKKRYGDRFYKNIESISQDNLDESIDFDQICNMTFTGLEPNGLDLKINRILGQLIKPFEELESTLSYMDEQARAVVLTNIFESCMKSYNPVKSMIESGRMYQGIAARNKISRYISKALNMKTADSLEHVNRSILSSNIFDRLNN